MSPCINPKERDETGSHRKWVKRVWQGSGLLSGGHGLCNRNLFLEKDIIRREYGVAWILYAISLIWVAMGSCMILYTAECRQLTKQLMNGLDQKIISIFPVIIGVMLIASMAASQNRWFIVVLGILALLKGTFVFMNPQGLYDRLAHWYVETASDQTYRLFGILAIILGTTVMSWII